MPSEYRTSGRRSQHCTVLMSYAAIWSSKVLTQHAVANTEEQKSAWRYILQHGCIRSISDHKHGTIDFQQIEFSVVTLCVDSPRLSTY